MIADPHLNEDGSTSWGPDPDAACSDPLCSYRAEHHRIAELEAEVEKLRKEPLRQKLDYARKLLGTLRAEKEKAEAEVETLRERLARLQRTASNLDKGVRTAEAEYQRGYRAGHWEGLHGTAPPKPTDEAEVEKLREEFADRLGAEGRGHGRAVARLAKAEADRDRAYRTITGVERALREFDVAITSPLADAILVLGADRDRLAEALTDLQSTTSLSLRQRQVIRAALEGDE